MNNDKMNNNESENLINEFIQNGKLTYNDLTEYCMMKGTYSPDINRGKDDLICDNSISDLYNKRTISEELKQYLSLKKKKDGKTSINSDIYNDILDFKVKYGISDGTLLDYVLRDCCKDVSKSNVSYILSLNILYGSGVITLEFRKALIDLVNARKESTKNQNETTDVEPDF